MSGLTDEDCEALVEAIRTGWHDGGMYGRADFDPRWLDGLASVTAADVAGAVEQIVARHVAAALNDAADAVAEYVLPSGDANDRQMNAGLQLAEHAIRARAT